MTDDRARKKAVRRRMAQTGEKYTEARRALEGTPSTPQTETKPERADHASREEFGRFTEGARQVVVLAREEARSQKHDVVGSEHILLGLLRERDGIAARVLGSLDITVERVRTAVVQRAGVGDGVAPSQLQFTPAAKEVLELALREALRMGDNYIGTEHILLGLVLESEGVAAGILLDFDADHERLRSDIIGILSGAGYRPPVAAGSTRHSAGMFERFTDRARRVIVLAELESNELGHGHIDGEHILLGLLREREGLAGRALEALGVTLEQARAGVLERVPRGTQATTGQRPFTPRANQIVELALREALMLRHTYIGTEHILLGLIRDGKSNATDVLVDLGADPRKVRGEVLHRMSLAAAGRGAERSQPEGLTAQEEVDLAKRIERGEPEAKEQMAQNNRHLVSSIADEYRGQGLSLEELKRAGTRGLVRATDTFDFRTGHRFSSYATHWIRQAIVRALSEQRR